MSNRIIEGVARAIGDVFGKEYPVYTEEVKQNFKRNSFFVKLNKPKLYSFLSGRQMNIATVEVQFFPDKNYKNKNMNNIADKTMAALLYVDVGNAKLRGFDIYAGKNAGVGISGLDTQYESMDGVLSVFASYRYRLAGGCASGDKAEIMENLELNKGVKQNG